MSDIAYGKVLEAFELLGVDDPNSVRSVLIEPHEVVVTRLDGKAQLGEDGALVEAKSTHPIKYDFEPAK